MRLIEIAGPLLWPELLLAIVADDHLERLGSDDPPPPRLADDNCRAGCSVNVASWRRWTRNRRYIGYTPMDNELSAFIAHLSAVTSEPPPDRAAWTGG